MGARFRFGTAGATGGGLSCQPASLGVSLDDSIAEPKWSYQQRSVKTKRDPARWCSRWSFGGKFSGGLGAGGDGESMLGMLLPNYFEPTSLGGGGCQGIKFIKGQCIDAAGNVAAGSVVQAFRTSDDAFAGEVQANGVDGTFDVPTQFVGVNHYLVAYKPGSPDIGGTTVNTLVPTNIDGT